MSTTHYVEEGSQTIGKELNKDKKQVLLIGDSIRQGYCEIVKDKITNVADVYYPSENSRSSQNVLYSLRLYTSLCNPETVDVLLFNCGHWDVAHWSKDKHSLTSKHDYKKNINSIIRIARLVYPKAKVVFATTTPMSPIKVENLNPRSTKEISTYNKIAKKVCAKNSVPIIDLFEFTKNYDASAFKDYCHFTVETNEKIATYVASEISKLF